MFFKDTKSGDREVGADLGGVGRGIGSEHDQDTLYGILK